MGRLTFALIGFLVASLSLRSCASRELKVFTIATEASDGYLRFMRSASLFDIDVEVLGMGKQFVDGESPLKLFREALQSYASSNSDDSVVLYVDSSNALFQNDAPELLMKFVTQYDEARILFAAEPFCRAGELCDKYPVARAADKNRYLNSGVFIGYTSAVLTSLSDAINDELDMQQFYTQLFLDEVTRSKHGILLDSRALLFQTMNDASKDLVLRYNQDGDSYMYNMRTGTRPVVLHAYDDGVLELNTISNYVPHMYLPTGQCQHCEEQRVQLDGLAEEDLPLVHVGLFVVRWTPFLDEFLDSFANLQYPRSRMRVYMADVVAQHRERLERFANSYAAQYNSLERVGSDFQCDASTATDCEWRVRATIAERCVADKASYYLQLDGHVHLDNEQTLRLLIEQNRTWLAPVIVRPGTSWSTFWGSVTPGGYYVRSDDYADIVHRERLGVWNVPFVAGVFLLHGNVLRNTLRFAYSDQVRDTYPTSMYNDPEVALAYYARNHGVFMWATNLEEFGHLVDNDAQPQVGVRHADLFERDRNRLDWERRYIHPDYWRFRQEGITLADFQQPCPDVFWFPYLSVRMAQELIDECNHFGKWSDGSHKDPRLDGGYENVPTRDIHMRQIAFEEHWLNMLRDYIKPIAELLFDGYHSEAQARMNFMVRYRPEEQPSLRPHHDASTYTLNIALNRRGIDYQGGGSRFLRYNCSILPTPDHVGWTAMHPGRLTHLHEGLPTTSGTRYIMVSFVDP